MKTFVINLEREPIKRKYIIQECQKLKLNFELYNAIDGYKLTENYIKENVFDYPECNLTKGEIGCALSHINVYKKIIEEDLPYALILEDDAILNIELPKFLSCFEKQKKEGITLLTADFYYCENKKFNIDNFEVFKVLKAVRATGYIITNNTAKKLVKFLLPIRYEADMFKVFKLCANINLYAVIPHLIETNDKKMELSAIQNDRKPLIVERTIYRKKVFKEDKKKRMIQLWFKRIVLQRFEKTKYYID